MVISWFSCIWAWKSAETVNTIKVHKNHYGLTPNQNHTSIKACLLKLQQCACPWITKILYSLLCFPVYHFSSITILQVGKYRVRFRDPNGLSSPFSINRSISQSQKKGETHILLWQSSISYSITALIHHWSRQGRHEKYAVVFYFAW